jgi:hypothetical protein
MTLAWPATHRQAQADASGETFSGVFYLEVTRPPKPPALSARDRGFYRWDRGPAARGRGDRPGKLDRHALGAPGIDRYLMTRR